MTSARARLLLPLVLAALLSACAQPPRTAPAPQQWSGRLALQVQDAPSQSFSARFELQGSTHAGELRLFNPLGNVLAQLRWSPRQAVLTQGQQQRTAPSLNTLVRELTGSDLPIAALFSWLQGQPARIDGWHADLDALDAGRLSAVRESPPPQVTLRIALDP